MKKIFIASQTMIKIKRIFIASTMTMTMIKKALLVHVKKMFCVLEVWL